MDKMQTYLVFATVAEQLSFTKAADILNLPRATVSTSIQSLEARLRVQLLNRTTRRVSLTLEGQVFLERCQTVLTEIDDLEKSFQQSTGKLDGRIKIDMPVNFAREIVLPRLFEFNNKFPEIEIDLSSHDTFIDVVGESVDLVIRRGDYSDSNFVVRKLMNVSIGNYASPAYLKERGVPKNLDDLKHHSLVTYSPSLGNKTGNFNYLYDREVKKVSMRTSINVNSTVSYTDACLGGLGIAQLPKEAVGSYVLQGKLIEVLPNYAMPKSQIDLIHLKNKKVSRRVLVFIDWLLAITSTFR
ncbi:Transcriptional Regulator, LysR family protein [Marinomonas sp. MED121]|uniref:LysR family transcriptional regulator n=1 Tax=Marinomonas sp. MED121 TaxID=314277 RepID=UPI0000690DB1|nr:LysR family transcriptional regulator [Marinomonas sp. MED121]EAQ65284.1 Transcriptional Regulator, LysR family protein [Marinomonas sp. MED121]